MNNLTFFLERSFEYVQNGRMQDITEAKKVDNTYKSLLDKYDIEFTSISSPYKIEEIVEKIISSLKNT